jgi:hypothetical protein
MTKPKTRQGKKEKRRPHKTNQDETSRNKEKKRRRVRTETRMRQHKTRQDTTRRDNARQPQDKDQIRQGNHKATTQHNTTLSGQKRRVYMIDFRRQKTH